MVGADGDRLEGGQGKGGSKGRRSGGGGGAGVDRIGLGAQGRHTGGERVRHQGGGVPGIKRLQWSRVERGGGLTHQAGTYSNNNVLFLKSKRDRVKSPT